MQDSLFRYRRGVWGHGWTHRCGGRRKPFRRGDEECACFQRWGKFTDIDFLLNTKQWTRVSKALEGVRSVLIETQDAEGQSDADSLIKCCLYMPRQLVGDWAAGYANADVQAGDRKVVNSLCKCIYKRRSAKLVEDVSSRGFLPTGSFRLEAELGRDEGKAELASEEQLAICIVEWLGYGHGERQVGKPRPTTAQAKHPRQVTARSDSKPHDPLGYPETSMMFDGPVDPVRVAAGHTLCSCEGCPQIDLPGGLPNGATSEAVVAARSGKVLEGLCYTAVSAELAFARPHRHDEDIVDKTPNPNPHYISHKALPSCRFASPSRADPLQAVHHIPCDPKNGRRNCTPSSGPSIDLGLTRQALFGPRTGTFTETYSILVAYLCPALMLYDSHIRDKEFLLLRVRRPRCSFASRRHPCHFTTRLWAWTVTLSRNLSRFEDYLSTAALETIHQMHTSVLASSPKTDQSCQTWVLVLSIALAPSSL
ncbi:hypothetical protein KC319_g40 [Hortaea werneckii]|nr:hypothetical protein KC319_g40 [Hortaea werneckii]